MPLYVQCQKFLTPGAKGNKKFTAICGTNVVQGYSFVSENTPETLIIYYTIQNIIETPTPQLRDAICQNFSF